MTKRLLSRHSLGVFAVLGLLLALEVSISPLGIGPDRRIHDPAVRRIADPTYLPGDWYTGMAVDSKVYTFYAKLVNLGPALGIPEELWRQGAFIACLLGTYFALLGIARLFSRSLWTVPLMAIFHAFLVLVLPPTWLYGPFIQMDGGLAPRSVGVAFSFLALYFLLKRPHFLLWGLLGLATLVHVSNSLIAFALLFGAYFGYRLYAAALRDAAFLKGLLSDAGKAVAAYLVGGGWFALRIAAQGGGLDADFPPDKFIWAWIYLRAPYMSLPDAPRVIWIAFFFHIAALLVAWRLLRPRLPEDRRQSLDLLGWVGMGGVAFFFAFYVFTFLMPWLPGFKFYSLRIVYFTYFTSYLFTALLVVAWAGDWIRKKPVPAPAVAGAVAALGLAFLLSPPGKRFAQKALGNYRASGARLAKLAEPIGPPPEAEAVARYLFLHPEPFLAPAEWYLPTSYLPHAASFKNFGFTARGMRDWYMRMDAVSRGEVERAYAAQKRAGKFTPVAIDWRREYLALGPEEVSALSAKYPFKLFLAPREREYEFPVVAEDTGFRLYRMP